jgi:hypothetical protein
MVVSWRGLRPVQVRVVSVKKPGDGHVSQLAEKLGAAFTFPSPVGVGSRAAEALDKLVAQMNGYRHGCGVRGHGRST